MCPLNHITLPTAKRISLSSVENFSRRNRVYVCQCTQGGRQFKRSTIIPMHTLRENCSWWWASTITCGFLSAQMWLLWKLIIVILEKVASSVNKTCSRFVKFLGKMRRLDVCDFLELWLLALGLNQLLLHPTLVF